MKIKLSDIKVRIETEDILFLRNTPLKLYDMNSKKPFVCNYCVGMKDGSCIPITRIEYKRIRKILKKDSDKE